MVSCSGMQLNRAVHYRQHDTDTAAAEVVTEEGGIQAVDGDENLGAYLAGNLQQVGAAGMTRGVQPLLVSRHLPPLVGLYRKPESSNLEVPEPVVQAAEVYLLLLVMRLAGAEDIQAPRPWADTGQFV